MIKRLLILAFAFSSATCFANLEYIDIRKISGEEKYLRAYTYLKENQRYYRNWSPDWTFDKPKSGFIRSLRDCYTLFSTISPKNEELFLLLGDISDYRYNLDDSLSYYKAIENYDSAIAQSPDDYRGYWFLGEHYSGSNGPVLAIENFFKAEKLLPADQPADFWGSYAFATMAANMPSHCLYGMNKEKTILGKPGYFETKLGPTVYARFQKLDPNKDYKNTDIWNLQKADRWTFIARPLGISLSVDSTWKLSVFGYKDHGSAFMITPDGIANQAGKTITYTIAVIMKDAGPKDNLADYAESFIEKYPDKTRISLFPKYEHSIAYEIKDKSMYQEIGGAHFYIIGVERSDPAYPGLLLEDAQTVPKSQSGKMAFYRPGPVQARFPGRIFYVILLDSCEDIFEKSSTLFKEMFEKNIRIE
jgi:hypothetical protein